MDTPERLAKVEVNIDNIKEDVKEIKDMLKEHVVWESDKYDEMGKKFANKWVEKVVYAIIIGVIGVVITWLKVGV